MTDVLNKRVFPFVNVSGEEIPAYGVVRISAISAEKFDNDQVETYDGDKPDGSDSIYAVNGIVPVADGEFGDALYSAHARMVYVNPAATLALGDKVGPVSGQWYAEKDEQGWLVTGTVINDEVAVLWEATGSGTTTDTTDSSCTCNCSTALDIEVNGYQTSSKMQVTVGAGSQFFPNGELRFIGGTFTIQNTGTIAVPTDEWSGTIPAAYLFAFDTGNVDITGTINPSGTLTYKPFAAPRVQLAVDVVGVIP